MVSMQTFFTALADRTRRRILNLIRDQELCVCFLTEVLDVSQPKISRHLAYLRNAEIVAARRDGKWMYYRITEPEDLYAAQILTETSGLKNTGIIESPILGADGNKEFLAMYEAVKSSN